MNFGCVYKIYNKLTGDTYIGSSVNPIGRRAQHLSLLRRGSSPHHRLQSSWIQYGESAFEFDVIEHVTNPELLREREQFWIDRLSPTLNTSESAYGPGTARWRALREKRIQTGEKTKFYHRYLLTAPDGRQICTDNLSAFCRYFNLQRRNLQLVARGKIRHSKGWTCQSIDNPIELKTGPIPTRRSKQYKGFRLTDPDGVVYEVEQLAPFAREHGLTVENLRKVAKGLRFLHKGWDCQFIPFD